MISNGVTWEDGGMTAAEREFPVCSAVGEALEKEITVNAGAAL